ncbi:ceramide glucosyltransferase [Aliirhizobium terrae]|uniref:ceramide glucosyltransferase n=1 Tax=Terrirhizobium terrae TaxID=2926709 RepID=UPI00257698CA|nr:ceramide glucosyltransferase [Rhizobium sp. CC-CFT758]WJH42241.1 ceramide glucosyltransferase [Rhizobium sp. CC-CFT758]
MSLSLIFGLAACALILANGISIGIAMWRLSRNGHPAPEFAEKPPVSLVIPACGIENFTPLTLERAFVLDWPDYELIFCVADARDPVISAIRKAMESHPHVVAQILVGDDRVSANPKLNNCVKGWQAARHDWVVLADSNVLMPCDYIAHLMAARRPDTGLVCSTPLGSRPDGFWAEVECAFLNSQQARWQYVGEALGLGFAQGKSMLWYKPMLDAEGGIAALGAEIAEDAAATKLVRRLGRRVHLVASPFEQPLGRRKLSQIWSRQARWARLRRVTFPAFFTPEILLGVMPPLTLALASVATSATDVSLGIVTAAVFAAVYTPELALILAKNWQLSVWTLPAMIARDTLGPAIWIRSWLSGSFDWRGNMMTIGTETSELSSATASR